MMPRCACSSGASLFPVGLILMHDTIPNKDCCYALMERYHVPPHIREHCALVSRVAVALAKELNKNGETLDINAIAAAALLHDMTKSNSVNTQENHAQTAARLLASLGYHRIAAIVNAHISVPLIANASGVTEEEVVNYADKRVRHNTVVSLNERFRDLMRRYGKTETSRHHIARLKTHVRAIEQKIFSRLPYTPDELAVLITRTSDL